MIASERLQKIVELTNKKEFISIKQLAEKFNVSEMTVRRDCEELDNQGEIVRVHGGVKSIRNSEILSKVDEVDMLSRMSVNFPQKDAVARKVSHYIKDGDCIFADGGSSIACMCKYIENKNIKVVTHSILIANAFRKKSNVELFLCGGKFLPEYQMNVGSIALSDLSIFNFDYAFISCAGVDLKRKQVYATETDTVQIKKCAIENSLKKYLLMDDSKLSVKGFYGFMKTYDFDVIACNTTKELAKEDLPDNFLLA